MPEKFNPKAQEAAIAKEARTHYGLPETATDEEVKLAQKAAITKERREKK